MVPYLHNDFQRQQLQAKAEVITDILLTTIDRIFNTEELREHFLAKIKQDTTLHETDFIWKVGMLS